jgi:hypothetical protein
VTTMFNALASRVASSTVLDSWNAKLSGAAVRGGTVALVRGFVAQRGRGLVWPAAAALAERRVETQPRRSFVVQRAENVRTERCDAMLS